jgi:hypothetical protein
MENILVIASEESVVHSQSTTMWIEEDEAKQVGIPSWRVRKFSATKLNLSFRGRQGLAVRSRGLARQNVPPITSCISNTSLG